jgi:hypothetical protein
MSSRAIRNSMAREIPIVHPRHELPSRALALRLVRFMHTSPCSNHATHSPACTPSHWPTRQGSERRDRLSTVTSHRLAKMIDGLPHREPPGSAAVKPIGSKTGR